jgi:FixJ family two-component response regulator
MPNLSGPELVDRLHAAGYRPKVLFASRHAVNALGEGVDVIEKPFSAATLIHRRRRSISWTSCSTTASRRDLGHGFAVPGWTRRCRVATDADVLRPRLEA